MKARRLAPAGMWVTGMVACAIVAGCGGPGAPATPEGPRQSPPAAPVAAGVPGAAPERLDPGVAMTIQNSRETTLRRVVPRPGGGPMLLSEFLVAGQAQPLASGEAERLRVALLTARAYLPPNLVPTCPVRPEVAVEFTAGDERVTMVASASCGAVSFYRNLDWRGSERVFYLDPRVLDLRDLLQSARLSHDVRSSSR